MEPRVAFEIGPIKVHWYGIAVTLGILTATFIASRELKRRSLDVALAWDGVLWVTGFGLVGARLYHVLSSPNDGVSGGWAYYSQNPLQIFAVWNGGLGIFGGLLGGTLGLWLFTRKHGVPFWIVADSAAPGVALGQAVGRWGNYFNQELYGGPTGSSWWGVTIDPPYRIRTPYADYTDLATFPPETRFHPTFLYESVWNLIGFALLIWLSRRWASRLREGDCAGGYLVWYGVGRAWIELLFRPDAWTIGSVPTAVLFAAAFVVLGVGVLVANRLSVPLSTQRA
ncbi:MAG: prolipoprotein diacylglyceryl transferase [Anaerolineae bacterium]|nr:prolipoprotein diacylglyceryl transferase [Thermoflexales bacterium]MDW8395628.1 prolipoprotein diacylglyceryl transferase [Anaerolineae bacterium]